MRRAFFLGIFLIAACAQTETTTDYFCEKIPSWFVNTSYSTFKLKASKNISKLDLELFKARQLLEFEYGLKYFTVYCPENSVQKSWAYAKAQHWNPQFIKIFQKTIDWKQNFTKNLIKAPEIAQQYLEKIPPLRREAIKLSRETKTSNDYDKRLLLSVTESIIQNYESVSRLVLLFSEKRAEPKDLFIIAQKYLIWTEKNRRGVNLLRKLAKNNYPPAQEKIAQMYDKGSFVKKNDKKSYYWYLKAKQSGLDVTNQIKRIESRLTNFEIIYINDLFLINVDPS